MTTKYQIICLTSARIITCPDNSWGLTYEMPAWVRQGIKLFSNHPIIFTNEECARWFISHRLVYNPKRKNSRKLDLMASIFEANNIQHWRTIKLDFDVQEVLVGD